MTTLTFILIIVALALFFDFLNGFHDAANSVATVVATGALKPFVAVFWVAFFNFIAFLFFHLNVANTIGVGLVDASAISPYVVFAALIGAIIFNLITWYYGLPASSSHALIGGLVGAAVAQDGWHILLFSGLSKTILAIFLSPLLGLGLAYLFNKIAHHFFVDNKKTQLLPWTKRIHLLSAALLSLGHGANDAQKTMGIIAVLLFSSKLIGPTFYVPFWVIVTCNLVMALGTLAGGWRIINTLGHKITKLSPYSGSVAQTSSAFVLFIATALGIPVSTTHIVTGSITGVGASSGRKAINWDILQKIAFAWLVTIPTAGLIAALIVFIKSFITVI